MKKIILPLLLLSAAAISPASANWFSNPYTNITRNIGSAPNPTPADVRENRLPIVTQDIDGTSLVDRMLNMLRRTAENSGNKAPTEPAGGKLQSDAAPSR